MPDFDIKVSVIGLFETIVTINANSLSSAMADAVTPLVLSTSEWRLRDEHRVWPRPEKVGE